MHGRSSRRRTRPQERRSIFGARAHFQDGTTIGGASSGISNKTGARKHGSRMLWSRGGMLWPAVSIRNRSTIDWYWLDWFDRVGATKKPEPDQSSPRTTKTAAAATAAMLSVLPVRHVSRLRPISNRFKRRPWRQPGRPLLEKRIRSHWICFRRVIFIARVDRVCGFV